VVVAGLDRAAVHHQGTKDTKDTKKKRDGGVHTHISLLFFVSFVFLRVLRVNWPHDTDRSAAEGR
jgi:hypothetical protein